jgi:hypothetical protein
LEFTNEQRYLHIQEWIAKAKDVYREPWATFPFWIAGDQITWPKVLFAMSKISGTFENGLIDIKGHYSKPTSSITWTVSLTPYLATRFANKPYSEAKEKRIDEMFDSL